MSVEFLLVLVLVVFPLLLGLVLLGRKAVTVGMTWFSLLEEGTTPAIIWDSSDTTPPITGNKPVGRVIGYDQFEAPMVLYRDNTSGTSQPGVFLGVRPNRFTTVAEVFYADPDCPVNGPAYIRSMGSAYLDLDFLSELQGITYAIGNGNVLWRNTSTGYTGTLLSKWTSQNTEDRSPAVHNPPGFPSTACTAVALNSTVTLDSLRAIERTSNPGDPGPETATAWYGFCSGGVGTCVTFSLYEALGIGTCVANPGQPPTAGQPTWDGWDCVYGGLPPTFTATISFDGSPPGNLSAYFNPPDGPGTNPAQFLITVIDEHHFTYTIPVVSEPNAPSVNAAGGQLQSVTAVIGTGGTADFHLALNVADLDAAPNFTTPFRMAFHRAVP